MNEPEQHPEQAPQPGPAETVWQTPDFVVIETALEVTAYSLTKR
ncbi:pyrroloquinoline quinone precursor peptide PqqA [Streptomyces sp. LX-29]|nr:MULTISPECIES: pyrroloquinoline quinone precursor peptide PqqA [unclassified Streptomyces]WFB10946.1 pyrroloquinoline quinone precursor peptide PqqA [Streptomyces sp. LX-29]